MILFFFALISCEEDSIQNKYQSWDSIILGEYQGSLELFCEADSFYMEDIKLIITRTDNNYTLLLDAKIKLNVEFINLSVLSVEDNVDKNDIVFVDIVENQYYQTREVGAYKNVIYINDILYSETEGPNVEIRLCLICKNQDDSRRIFIRAKKIL